MQMINIADLKDPDDPQGRSYRQINLERKHEIPIGALVEVEDKDGHEDGIRLFVVHHAWDCDQTPLYCLCHDPRDTVRLESWRYNCGWLNGYPESCLKVIRLPES